MEGEPLAPDGYVDYSVFERPVRTRAYLFLLRRRPSGLLTSSRRHYEEDYALENLDPELVEERIDTGGHAPLVFRHAKALKFSDVSSEVQRTYVYSDCSITIRLPLRLHVSGSGGHRLFCENTEDGGGVSRYVAPGWKYIEWIVREGRSHFDF